MLHARLVLLVDASPEPLHVRETNQVTFILTNFTKMFKHFVSHIFRQAYLWVMNVDILKKK